MKTPKSASSMGGENAPTLVLRPVGVIRSKIHKPFLAAEEDDIKMQGDMEKIREEIHRVRREISEIVIKEELVDLLRGVEDYSHLVVLYWAHKVPDQSRSLTLVHPMGREENPLTGIFGTCSPARPNPVLMTVVRLWARKENVLQVTGMDAIDGSPLIDIKPYVKGLYPQGEVQVPEWMRKIQDEVDEGRKKTKEKDGINPRCRL